MHRGGPGFTKAIDQIGGGDPPSFLFAVPHEEDLRDDHQVGLREGVSELFEQKAGAAVLVGLKDADQPTGTERGSNRSERHVALARMMAIVIDDGRGASVAGGDRAQPLHPAINPFEAGHRLADGIPISAEPMGEDCAGGGVQGVVITGKPGIPAHDVGPVLKQTHASGGGVVNDLVVRGRGETEGADSRRQATADFAAMAAVVGDEQPPSLVRRGQQAGEITKTLDDLVDRSIKVQMILFDVVDQCHRGPVSMERVIEFAGLGHEDSGASVAVTAEAGSSHSPAATELRASCSGDVTGIQTALHQAMGEHRCRRTLAVGAGNGDPGAASHGQPDRIGVAEDSHIRLVRGLERRVILPDGGTGDHQIAPFWKSAGEGIVPGGDLDSGSSEVGHRLGFDRIGSAGPGATIKNDPGESAHARAADPQKVDAAMAKRIIRAERVHGSGGIGRRGGGRRRHHRHSIGGMGLPAPPWSPAGGGEGFRPTIAVMTGSTRASEAERKVRAQVLIVDDEGEHAEVMAEALRKPGHVCTIVNGLEAARDELLHGVFDVVVTDLVMEHETAGLDVLSLVQEQQPDAATILVTAHGDIPTAKAALQGGAYDFIEKPLDLVVFRNLVDRAAETVLLRHRAARLEDQLDAAYGIEGIIGESAGIRGVINQIRKVGPSTLPVLVTGESGTGKELVAAAIHRLSKRGSKRYATFNTAGQSESLLEDQLFGHVRGAYTGADRDREGVFEYADGGTLFLDEIGDMPVSMQPRLLRVLESGEVIRLGSNDPKKVDVRFVSATNRDLRKASEDGGFREDLYFRIRGVEIHIPPLRSRRDDIPLLVNHAAGRFAAEMDQPIPLVTEPAMLRLVGYSWPGNVRELFNAVHRMVIACEGDRIEVRDVPEEIRSEDHDDDSGGIEGGSLAGVGLDRLEKEAIRQTLALTGGNREQTANLLGIGERTLYRKLKEYGLR